MSVTPARPVAIVGAGLAGLAAATELSSRNIPVTVLEQKAHGGGRAYSFTDAATGETIDNGQHALINGYAATMRYLDLIGSRGLLLTQHKPGLAFHHPSRGICRFTLPALPSPLHLLGGIITTDLFSIRDRLRLLRAGRALQRLREDDPRLAEMTVMQWLRRHGQSDETIRSFWEPLAIAIMNEKTAVASALLFVRCLRRAFLRNSSDAALVLPSVGLSELFVHPACRYIAAHGGEVTFGARVTGLLMEEGRVDGVRLADGTERRASSVVLAVPPWSIESVLPEGFPERERLVRPAALPLSPIVSVHLWYSKDFMEQDALGVIGRTVQWIFNRRRISREPGTGGHLSCVISAAGEVVGMSTDELIARADGDVRAVFGQTVPPVQHGVVIREKRATFSPRPGLEALRPDQQAGVPGLFLAGDWTATGLPGTIEGAVWSGQRCAELYQAETGSTGE